jgi:antitoxin YefM
LNDVMDRVVEDHAPVVITRQKAEPVVMVSLSDWLSLEATARLISSPKNASRLAEAFAEVDAGRGDEEELAVRGVHTRTHPRWQLLHVMWLGRICEAGALHVAHVA